MFEGLRKNSQSFMLVVLIASLAAMFGVSFGPGARGCNPQSLRVSHIARVYGTTITEPEFVSMARLRGLSESRNQEVMRRAIVNGLVERELLAHEAERLGFRISNADIDREIRDGYYYSSLGIREMAQLSGPFGLQSVSARGHTSYAGGGDRRPEDPPPPFAYDDFDNWVRGYFGRTVPDYKRMMEREMLAELMRNVVMGNVRVSDDEVWRDYARQHNQVTLRYMQFSPDFYRTVVRDDDNAALDAFATAHADEINRQYTASRETLRGLPDQVKVRQILLSFPEGAAEPSQLATLQRATALRARIVAGEDFVRLARLYSQDSTNWRTAGTTSWVTRDHVDAPDDVKVALRTMHAGELSQPIRSALGYHLVQVIGERHGDVAEADAKRDIARDLFRLVRGTELTNEAALRTQQLLNAPGATFDTVAATVHAEALTAFYHGDIPATLTLPGNNALEPVTRSDVGGPELRETPAFPQTANVVPEIIDSGPMVGAAFQLTDAHPMPATPIAIHDDRYVIRLRDGGRQVASRDEFNHNRLELMESYGVAKRREALEQFIGQMRTAAEHDGQLHQGNSPLIAPRPTDRSAPPDREGAG